MMKELDDELFKMTQQEIREHVDDYNEHALAHVLYVSGCTETFLRELKTIFGDNFIYHNFSVTDDFMRELKLKND